MKKLVTALIVLLIKQWDKEGRCDEANKSTFIQQPVAKNPNTEACMALVTLC